MFKWLRGEGSGSLASQIDARFPPDVLFRFPIAKLPVFQSKPQFLEDPAEWEKLFKGWPLPPTTAAEATARENTVFESYAGYFTVEDSLGRPSLVARLKMPSRANRPAAQDQEFDT